MEGAFHGVVGIYRVLCTWSLDDSSAADVAWVPAAESVAASAGPRGVSAPQGCKEASLTNQGLRVQEGLVQDLSKRQSRRPPFNDGPDK